MSPWHVGHPGERIGRDRWNRDRLLAALLRPDGPPGSYYDPACSVPPGYAAGWPLVVLGRPGSAAYVRHHADVPGGPERAIVCHRLALLGRTPE